MANKAHLAGLGYARFHAARPCLGTLVRGWGYSDTDALWFAIGFYEAKKALGLPVLIQHGHCAPSCDTLPAAYLDGRRYAREHDFPPCHPWLKLQGYDPMSVLHWMRGFQEEKFAQGWSAPIDWRGEECRCGDSCK